MDQDLILLDGSQEIHEILRVETDRDILSFVFDIY
jgi:hypothetical protein